MFKKLMYLATCVALLALFSGCANRPIRSFFRGAFCNSCQPPVGQPIGCGTNYAPSCDTGACANPAISGITAPVQTPVFGSAPVEIPMGQPSLGTPTFDNGIPSPGMSGDVINTIPSSNDIIGNGIPTPSPTQGSGTR